MKFLYQKEKKSKIFQVKTLSKDVRKTIVPSFMFLFNFSKSVVLCVKKCKCNTVFTTGSMKQKIHMIFYVRS